MTAADRRAVFGTCLALIGGALLLHDLWTQLHVPNGEAANRSRP